MKIQTPPAYGSSRTTGGHIRGNAQGNTANIADLEDEPSIVNHPKKVGFVFLYHSTTCTLQHLDQMEDTNSFFKVTGPPTSLTPVLKLLEQKYPNTKCMCYITTYTLISHLTYILDECIHIWDADLEKCKLIGPFELALNHTMPIEFILDANKHNIFNILTVSLSDLI